MAALPIQVNLIPGYDHVPPVVKLNQYEYGLTRQFEVYYGGEKYTIPSGSTVRIEGAKPDRTGYSYAASFSGSIITVTIKEQMTVLAGYHEAELVIIPSTTLRASTINLRMDVERGALGKDVPISETELPAIVDAAKSFASAAASSATEAAASATQAASSAASAEASAETAEQVLASIPADYTALDGKVTELKNDLDVLGLSVVDGKLCITYKEVSA